jgi:uncharacterized protein YbbC (DUF1343 family)
MLVACLDLFRGEFEFLPTSWEGQPPHIDLLTGDPAIRLALLDGADVREIARRWSRDVRAFARQRTRSLLYD